MQFGVYTILAGERYRPLSQESIKNGYTKCGKSRMSGCLWTEATLSFLFYSFLPSLVLKGF